MKLRNKRILDEFFDNCRGTGSHLEKSELAIYEKYCGCFELGSVLLGFQDFFHGIRAYLLLLPIWSVFSFLK